MNRLYRVKPDLPAEEKAIILRNGIDPNETLWLVADRPGRGIASGERYGIFTQTYASTPGNLSPTNGKRWENMPMRYFQPVTATKDDMAGPTQALLTSYALSAGTDGKGAVRDLLTHLMHHCDKMGYDFEGMLASATSVYEEECELKANG